MRPSDAMTALLRFDRPALEAAVGSPGADRRDDSSGSDEVALERRLDRAWLAIANGQVPEQLVELERAAASAGLASLVVRVAAAQALGSATVGRLDEALEVARRASRMGRTEALPEAEYLAALVLARVRRLTGRPYLATRILTALAGYAPPAWHGWLAWELAMASGGRGPVAASGPSEVLLDALTHLDQGHGAHWRTSTRALAETMGFAPLRHDLRRTRVALDPEVASDDPALERWLAGQPPHEPPYGLLGLEGASGSSAVAYAVAGPGRPGRRMLQRGARLVDGAHAMPPTPRRQARVDGLLAGLALAAPHPVEEAELFAAVYGFKYSRNVHKEVLHVAIHRARDRLADHGAIVRDGSRLSLELRGPVLFVDPRCTPPVDDRVLLFVAKRGRITAKEAAGALGIPLRSAQGALKDLVEGGACKQRRQGRKVAYEVEDTTFREPTFS